MLGLLAIIFTVSISVCAWGQVEVDSLDTDTTHTESKIDFQQPEDFYGSADTLVVERREFESKQLELIKTDPDLNYKQPPTVAETLWDRFKMWLAWFFSSLVDAATTTDLGKLALYVLEAVIIVGVIMALLKVNAFKVFYSGADQARQGYQVFHENIHEMDFDRLIQDAVGKAEFRVATRLMFLHALKLLSDKHLIEFNPGKTNHDYVDELKVAELKTGLNELSFYFDYAWYGNFNVTEGQFQKITTVFNSWRQRIS